MAPSAETSSAARKRRTSEKSAKPKILPVSQPIHVDDYDTSDEEDLRNTIGNIPIQWYDEHDHVGYGLEGNPLARAGFTRDQIDRFLERVEDKDHWRKVFDRQAGGDATLSDEQVEKLQRVTSGRFPKIGYNPYEPLIEFCSKEAIITPLTARPEPKSSFLPSRDEVRLVGRMVHAIKMGWLKPRKPKTRDGDEEDEKPIYDLWAADAGNNALKEEKEDEDAKKSKSERARERMNFPAPKVRPPKHAESYNPAEEYLFDEKEREKWLNADADERRLDYMPTRFDALRRVPGYARFFNDRFERCLDLYLAPRKRIDKLQVDSRQLLPELPSPADLKPFPTTVAFYMLGHKGAVHALSVEPTKGELLASGGEDGTVRIWSLRDGRQIRSVAVGGPVVALEFCPRPGRTLILVAVGGGKRQIRVVETKCGDKLEQKKTREWMRAISVESDGERKVAATWTKTTADDTEQIQIDLSQDPVQASWHSGGDYFVTLTADTSTAGALMVHHLSRARTQCPFSKARGPVSAVRFHPNPDVAQLYVATVRHVRLYDLARCQLRKKLITGVQAISTIATDQGRGDNVLVGGRDRRLAWMDLDLSASKPWKSMRHHAGALRAIAFHKRYPLLASASDDGRAIVYHARIDEDGFEENFVVPLRRLAMGETQTSALLATTWHPTQPWLIAAEANGRIALFSH